MTTYYDDPQDDQQTPSDDNSTDDVEMPGVVMTEDEDEDAKTPTTEDTADEPTDEEEPKTEDTATDEDEPAKEQTEEEEVMYATPDALKDQSLQGAVSNAATNLISLESLINRHVADIEKLKEQMKTQKDMFNDTFNNDAVYAEHAEKAKEVNRLKNTAKQKLLKQPAVVALAERINSIKEEMKDLQEALSSYLKQYQEISKTNQIVGENGEVREIITSHKLIKKGGKGRP